MCASYANVAQGLIIQQACHDLKDLVRSFEKSRISSQYITRGADGGKDTCIQH